MKKIVNFIFIFLFVFSLIQYRFNAASANGNYTTISSTCDATVIEVIDGDSVLVKVNATGQFALVHMIGIDSQGYTPAFEYVTSILLGRTVFIVPDGNIKSPVDRWNYAYIFLSSSNFNNTLVANGYAKVKTTDSKAIYYKEFVEYEKKAKAKNLGIWNVSTNVPSYVYSGSMVNINTSTQAELRDNLKITDGIASNIVTHRKLRPFKTIYDVKFVDGMTKEIFDDIRYKIVVSTNIITASKEELVMLAGISDDDAQKIIDYREKFTISNISILYTEKIITQSKYSENKPYISLKDVDRITYSVPDKIININTASEAQMKSIELLANQIDKIIEYRKYYTFKTIKDVSKSLALSDTITDYLTDNMTLITDVNNATVDELKSLFGSHADAIKNTDIIIRDRPFNSDYFLERSIGSDMYKRIKNYIFITESNATNYININTATVGQMTAIGFNSTQANKLYSNRLEMLTVKDIPYDLKALGLDMKVTLYSNVNTASISELKSLSAYVTDDVANSIVEYREDQPFGSLDEFSTFMSKLNKGFVYDIVKKVISVY